MVRQLCPEDHLAAFSASHATVTKQLRPSYFRRAAAGFAAWTNQFGLSWSLTEELTDEECGQPHFRP